MLQETSLLSTPYGYTTIEMASSRAQAIALDLESSIARDLATDLAITLAITTYRATMDLAIARAHDLPRAIERARENTIDLSHKDALPPNLVRLLVRERRLARDLARDCVLDLDLFDRNFTLDRARAIALIHIRASALAQLLTDIGREK